MADLAKTVRYAPSKGILEIDGEEFPWYVSADGVEVKSSRGDLTTVTVTILVDGPVEVEPTLPSETS